MAFTPTPLSTALAYLAIYFVWGTTYFGIAIALTAFPPFAIGTARFALATLLAGIMVFSQRRNLAGLPIGHSLFSGMLLGGMGNGFVIFAQQDLPSGITALIVTTVPVVVLLLDWAWFSKRRPGPRATLGLLLALAGVTVIVLNTKSFEGAVPLVALGFVFAAVLGWSIGTLLQTNRTRADQLLGVTALQMLGATLFTLLMSIINGEWSSFPFENATLPATAAIVYLAVFGSIVTQNCYVWLLTHQPAPKVATYALVNPVVAVLLGTLLLSEPFTAWIFVGSCMVLTGVGFVLFRRRRSPQTKEIERPVDQQRTAARAKT